MSAFKVAVFSAKPYDRDSLNQSNTCNDIQLSFYENKLDGSTVQLAQNCDAVCVFVNDCVDAGVMAELAALGIRHIALRCAGFNNVDLKAAQALGISVSRVPAYAPEAVAEHSIALMMALNRKLHKAYNRVKEDNFNLAGLLGFNFRGKTVGVIGTGKIGQAAIRILQGLGCHILAVDPYPNSRLIEQGVQYCDLNALCQVADIISLYCPLTSDTQHIINVDTLAKMKTGVMLINTSRGGLIDTKAVIKALKTKKLGYLGLDVYEMEAPLFFEDRSNDIITDDNFQRLLTFPNVMITGHQGFFTQEALAEIATTTLENITAAMHGDVISHQFLLS